MLAKTSQVEAYSRGPTEMDQAIMDAAVASADAEAAAAEVCELMGFPAGGT